MVRTILRDPDPRLHTPCAAVASTDALDPDLVPDLLDTLRAEGGVGLAAPQVGAMVRVFVLDARDSPLHQVFVNPRLVSGSRLVVVREGCLSVPGAQARKRRYADVEVAARDGRWRAFTVRLGGLAAVAAQHELDHLAGRLMTDR